MNESKADKEFCDHCLLPAEFASDNENYALCMKHAEEQAIFKDEKEYQPINNCIKENGKK